MGLNNQLSPGVNPSFSSADEHNHSRLPELLHRLLGRASEKEERKEAEGRHRNDAEHRQKYRQCLQSQHSRKEFKSQASRGSNVIIKMTIYKNNQCFYF